MTEFESLHTFITKLTNTQGTNAKIEFVKNNATEQIKRFLAWYFDTSKVTGIASKKWDKIEVEEDIFSSLGGLTFWDLIDYIDNHNTGRDEDVSMLKKWALYNVKDNEQLTFKNIFTKNLVLGIDAKGINKAFANLVPTFDVMLADKYLDLDEKTLNKVTNHGTREFVLQEKLDGCVSEDTIVITDIGALPIKYVVEDNLGNQVLSYNENTNQLELKNIENRMSKEDNKQWYEIELENGDILKITENDLLLTNNGYKRVDELTCEDFILC